MSTGTTALLKAITTLEQQDGQAVLQVDIRAPYSLQPLTDGALVAVMPHSYSQDRHWLAGLHQGNGGMLKHRQTSIHATTGVAAQGAPSKASA